MIQIEQNILNANIQNFIVYAIVISIVLYILLAIILSYKEESIRCSTKKHSISSRRGR